MKNYLLIAAISIAFAMLFYFVISICSFTSGMPGLKRFLFFLVIWISITGYNIGFFVLSRYTTMLKNENNTLHDQ